MFEGYFLEAEQKHHIFKIIAFTFVITFVLGLINFYIGANFLFLVALVSLALAYPVVNYIQAMDKEELENRMSSSNLLVRHERELTVFWSIFVGLVLGFYLLALSGFITDFSLQQTFVEQVTGYITQSDVGFELILLNNLQVAFFTFLISLVAFSGLIFVLTWNASLVAYYLFSLGSPQNALITGALLLPHGLLEIGGYVMIGIAGSVLAYRFDRHKKGTQQLNSELYKDVSILVALSVAFIVVGAAVEVL